jgi:DNA topoisomerase-3
MKGQQITYRGYRLYEDLFKEKYGNSKSDKADKEKNEEEKAVPDVQAPYSFTAAMSMEEKETKPLSHFTEDTLLDVMDKAGSKEMSDEVERKGLGTSATRAGVIEKLIACKYIKRDKKKLLATDEGKYLISVVPEKIKSVSLTCDWENELLDVSAGKMEYDMFMKETKSFISTIIDENKNINAVERRNNKEVICVCPVCGNSITDGKYGAYCNGKCGISFSVIDGRRLTPSQIKSLIGDRKEVLLKDLKSSKCGTYDVYVKYAGTEKYSFTKSDGNEKSGYNLKLTLRFPEKKKKG